VEKQPFMVPRVWDFEPCLVNNHIINQESITRDNTRLCRRISDAPHIFVPAVISANREIP
jgi:hypothetical protein